MLIVGAMAVVGYAERHGAKRPWLVQPLARRKTKVAAVALANKNARMIWTEPARFRRCAASLEKQAEGMVNSGERDREPLVA